MEIYIDNRQDKIIIDEEMEEMIEKVVKEVLVYEELPLNCEVSVSFVSNEEIKELNSEFRGIDEETDVLSFPMDEEFILEGPRLLGDIIISMEKSLEQSMDFGHSLTREIAYLTAHSMFHLLGYDHMEEDEKSLMRSKEKEVMRRLNIFKGEEGE